MNRKPVRFVIHPSIDTLVERIAAVTTATPPAEVAELRDACRGKVRSYPVDSYLRNQTDAATARARYDAVATFAAARAG